MHNIHLIVLSAFKILSFLLKDGKVLLRAYSHKLLSFGRYYWSLSSSLSHSCCPRSLKVTPYWRGGFLAWLYLDGKALVFVFVFVSQVVVKPDKFCFAVEPYCESFPSSWGLVVGLEKRGVS